MTYKLKRTLCPECNFDDVVIQFKKGYIKPDADYTFMYPMTYLHKDGKRITPGVYYCHECGHIEKKNKEGTT
jgi:hypothetical protein